MRRDIAGMSQGRRLVLLAICFAACPPFVWLRIQDFNCGNQPITCMVSVLPFAELIRFYLHQNFSVVIIGSFLFSTPTSVVDHLVTLAKLYLSFNVCLYVGSTSSPHSNSHDVARKVRVHAIDTCRTPMCIAHICLYCAPSSPLRPRRTVALPAFCSRSRAPPKVRRHLHAERGDGHGGGQGPPGQVPAARPPRRRLPHCGPFLHRLPLVLGIPLHLPHARVREGAF